MYKSRAAGRGFPTAETEMDSPDPERRMRRNWPPTHLAVRMVHPSRLQAGEQVRLTQTELRSVASMSESGGSGQKPFGLNQFGTRAPWHWSFENSQGNWGTFSGSFSIPAFLSEIL